MSANCTFATLVCSAASVTKGGKWTFAAVCMDGGYAQFVYFAKSAHNFKADIRKTRPAGCYMPSLVIASGTTLRLRWCVHDRPNGAGWDHSSEWLDFFDIYGRTHHSNILIGLGNQPPCFTIPFGT